MTYRRHAGTFAAAVTRIKDACGVHRAALAAGVSELRVRQMSNPMRGDLNVLAHAAALDMLAAADGQGTPIFDVYRARLEAAGALAPARATLRIRALEAAIAAAVAALVAVLPNEVEAAA